jgi:acetyl esterase/lipase
MQLDTEIGAILAASPLSGLDFGALDLSALPGLRQAMASMPVPPMPSTTVVQRDVEVPGEPPVMVRVYEPPASGEARPCLYWIHGGGYMFGSGLMPDARLCRWAESLGCVVVSVDYRLAPEHPYPEPLDDCYQALAWVASHGSELGIDPARIVIGGASAGGGLAAAVALQARDRGEVKVAFQLLIYPMIDDRERHVSSLYDSPVWNRTANDLGWRAYLGAAVRGPDVPPYAAPGRADDLSGLPSTLIAVGTLDVFRDEDLDYAARLLQAGVETELHIYPGAPHGFETMAPTAALSLRCDADMVSALRRAMA